MSELVNSNIPAEVAEETTPVADTDYKAEAERLRIENEKLRRANTSASSDVSRYKKALQERMSEEERNRAEREENEAKMKAELESLRREKTVSDHRASFVGLGFSQELAQNSAEAVADGNYSAMFDNIRQYITQLNKEHTAETFRNTPKPVAGNNPNGITKEQFDNMGYKERDALYRENKELYDELNKKE